MGTFRTNKQLTSSKKRIKIMFTIHMNLVQKSLLVCTLLVCTCCADKMVPVACQVASQCTHARVDHLLDEVTELRFCLGCAVILAIFLGACWPLMLCCWCLSSKKENQELKAKIASLQKKVGVN